MQRVFVAALLLAVCVAPLSAGQDLAEAVAKDYETSLASLFVWFHSHPELSFREYETAARLAEELRTAGVDVTEGVGGTGVVGMLRNGDGPLVMVRADMDGLPKVEVTEGTPPTVNDEELAARVHEAFVRDLGDGGGRGDDSGRSGAPGGR